MVTLVTLDNPYKESELDKFAADFASGDETSMTITHLTEQKYLVEFPDFWMRSGTGANSCLIFIAPTGKDVGAKNSFVGTDGMEKVRLFQMLTERTREAAGIRLRLLQMR